MSLVPSDIGGRPVSQAIMGGNSYDLMRERDDLYQRVAKTVNMEYDPRQLKTFLKELAKTDQASEFRPKGLTDGLMGPSDLVTRYKHMLYPLASKDENFSDIMTGSGKRSILR